MVWTVDQENELRRLQAQNLSASAIALEMACGLSRNSIIGKLHRMGLRPSSQPHAAIRGVRKPRKPRTQRRAAFNPERALAKREAQHAERKAKAAERAAMFAAQEAVELPPEDLSKAVTLLDLSGTHCRWPIGDPSDIEAFRFCGDTPHPEKPYCRRHCRMAYVRPKPPGQQRVAA